MPDHSFHITATPEPPGPQWVRHQEACAAASVGAVGAEGSPTPGSQAPPDCCSHTPTHPQDDSYGSIECVNEERRLHKKVCNVSYPFFRAKAKVEAGGNLGRDQGGYTGRLRETREMEASRGED